MMVWQSTVALAQGGTVPVQHNCTVQWCCKQHRNTAASRPAQKMHAVQQSRQVTGRRQHTFCFYFALFTQLANSIMEAALQPSESGVLHWTKVGR